MSFKWDLSLDLINPTGLFYPLLLFESHIARMTEITESADIEEIKKENDRIIVKIFGLNYEKFFPQEHQCEK